VPAARHADRLQLFLAGLIGLERAIDLRFNKVSMMGLWIMVLFLRLLVDWVVWAESPGMQRMVDKVSIAPLRAQDNRRGVYRHGFTRIILTACPGSTGRALLLYMRLL
jgi:hypothetical protein